MLWMKLIALLVTFVAHMLMSIAQRTKLTAQGVIFAANRITLVGQSFVAQGE
jgi:hypothetical protein